MLGELQGSKVEKISIEDDIYCGALESRSHLPFLGIVEAKSIIPFLNIEVPNCVDEDE